MTCTTMDKITIKIIIIISPQKTKQNICCGYSSDAPRRGASDVKYPQRMIFMGTVKRDLSRYFRKTWLIFKLWFRNVHFT